MSDLAERFQAAVHVLVNDGSVKQRLVRAYSEHLEQLEEAEIPQRLDTPLADLHRAMHRIRPAGTESRVKASVQKMSAPEAGGYAESIVALYIELLRLGHRAEPLKIVDSARPAKAAASNS